MGTSEIIKQAQEFIEKLYAEQVSEYYCYHSIKHTRRVVAMAEEIGVACGLNKTELEILLLAAWFHDAGFAKTYLANEPDGVKIAKSFLKKKAYPAENIERIKNTILATELTYKPTNLLQQIIRDADLIHLGQPDFIKINDLLRKEWKLVLDREMTDEAWIKLSIDFQEFHSFNTTYAIEKYGPIKAQNIEQLKQLAL